MTGISDTVFIALSSAENIQYARKFFFTFLVNSLIMKHIPFYLMLYKPSSLNHIVIFKSTL